MVNFHVYNSTKYKTSCDGAILTQFITITALRNTNNLIDYNSSTFFLPMIPGNLTMHLLTEELFCLQ